MHWGWSSKRVCVALIFGDICGLKWSTLPRSHTILPGNYLSSGDLISCEDDVAWRWWEMHGCVEKTCTLMVLSQCQATNEHRHCNVTLRMWAKTANIDKSKTYTTNMVDDSRWQYVTWKLLYIIIHYTHHYSCILIFIKPLSFFYIFAS